MHTDFTIVNGSGASGSEARAFASARAGARDKDHYVKAADKSKNNKYHDRCRRAHFSFLPFALSTGGRTSPCGLKLLKLIYKAAEDRVDNWYYWGVLVPRLYAALALGQYEHATAVRRDIYAKLAAQRPGGASTFDEASAPPPPAGAHARSDFDETYDCDARWAWNRDGSGTFEHERGQAYSQFLRETHPAFFEASV